MPSYLLACSVMGLGIGFDVVLATLSRIRHISGNSSWVWVQRISFTHVLFPMIGYYLFVGLFRSFPSLRIALGVIAFALIVIFLVDILKTWVSEEGEEDNSEPFAWTVVLSVSWDALFSGPAKSAQAIGWSTGQVLLSFIISGAVVTILAISAVGIAYLIRHTITKILSSTFIRLTLLNIAMMFVEFIILAYFGILALMRYTLMSDISFSKIAIISFLIGAFVFIIFWNSLFRKAQRRIASNVTGPG